MFSGARVAVFIDGCFWHRCPQHYQRPVRNAEYWSSKVATTCERDLSVTTELNSLGWRVVRVWEHEVERCLKEVVDRICAEVAAGSENGFASRRE